MPMKLIKIGINFHYYSYTDRISIPAYAIEQ
jgi:hypothetical protein